MYTSNDITPVKTWFWNNDGEGTRPDSEYIVHSTLADTNPNPNLTLTLTLALTLTLFLELGWEPVYTFMNWQRVAYYARFQNLADDRLCKVIFNMLRNTENSEYHAYFKNLFIDLGLDHYVYKVL